jgi:hypothetical protein
MANVAAPPQQPLPAADGPDAALVVLLDPELLAMIFQWLPRDRTTLRCGLICRTWLQAVFAKSLWSSVRLTFKDPEDRGQAAFLAAVADGVQRLEVVDITDDACEGTDGRSAAEQRHRLASLRDSVTWCLTTPLPHLVELR